MVNELIPSENTIKNRIYTIRGMQVMLDRDLAELYDVETKKLNQSVKRNTNRFPSDFMFQLTKYEKDELVTNCDHLKALKFSYSLPFVFSEQGVANLSSVLSSDKAVEVNIQIIRAFVSMRRLLVSNPYLLQRLDNVEQKQVEYDKKFEQVFKAIEDKDINPEKGIFFEGQIFDAYRFVSELIRSAKTSIILIDNYVDDSVLTLFTKRNKNVSVEVFTKEITKQLSLDLTKHNSQYPLIEIKEFKYSHDQFLIIDDREVYHFGASLKDLGKKWFAFSKFDKEAFNLLDKIKEIKK